jgi:Secretion system C-terminal sorting domain
MSLDNELSRGNLTKAASKFFGGNAGGRDLNTGSDIFIQSGTLKARSAEYFRYDSKGDNLNVVLTGKGKNNADPLGNIDLQVFDASGQEVARSDRSDKKAIESINLGNLRSGTYFIAITNESDQAVDYDSEASNNTTSDLIAPERSVDFNKVMEGRVGDRDTSDFYALSFNRKTNLQVVLDEPSLGLDRGQNAEVKLILDKKKEDRLVQRNEKVDPSQPSQENGNKRTFLFKDLDPNQRYYIQVASQGRGSNAFYELKVTQTNAPGPVSDRPVNSLADNLLINPVTFADGLQANPESLGTDAPVLAALSPISVNADLSSLSVNSIPDTTTTLSALGVSNLMAPLPTPLEMSIVPAMPVSDLTVNAASWESFDLASL